MPTRLEEFAAQIGRHVFLSEFSFSKNTFRAACGAELELADHLIVLPDETLIFQLKERNPDAPCDEGAMLKWFNRKVLKKGCGQLRDSVVFLQEQPKLSVPNQRGHLFDLSCSSRRVVKLLLYSASGATLPGSVSHCRHRISDRAGFVHVLSLEDYYNLCQHLVLPRELSLYFSFREDFLRHTHAPSPQEAELAAMFVSETSTPPDEATVRKILQAAIVDAASFDLGPILRRYGEKVTYVPGEGEDLDYYRTLEVFCRLHRADLRGFKNLLTWAFERAGGTDLEVPCRLRTSTGAGFVVFPVPAGRFAHRINALANLTALLKYDWKLDCTVGVSVAKDGNEFEIDWCHQQGPWQFDSDIERQLSERYPFRERPIPKVVFRYPGRENTGG